MINNCIKATVVHLLWISRCSLVGAEKTLCERRSDSWLLIFSLCFSTIKNHKIFVQKCIVSFLPGTWLQSVWGWLLSEPTISTKEEEGGSWGWWRHWKEQCICRNNHMTRSCQRRSRRSCSYSQTDGSRPLQFHVWMGQCWRADLHYFVMIAAGNEGTMIYWLTGLEGLENANSNLLSGHWSILWARLYKTILVRHSLTWHCFAHICVDCRWSTGMCSVYSHLPNDRGKFRWHEAFQHVQDFKINVWLLHWDYIFFKDLEIYVFESWKQCAVLVTQTSLGSMVRL